MIKKLNIVLVAVFVAMLALKGLNGLKKARKRPQLSQR